MNGSSLFRGPNLKIYFLYFLDTKEQELPADFYCIEEYCSLLKLCGYDLSKLGLCPRLNEFVWNFEAMFYGPIRKY